MSQNFSCPNCKKQQKLKHLILMSSQSTWICDYCSTLIKPVELSVISNIIGFLSVVIPAYFCLFILKYSIGKTILISLLIAVSTYLISLVYYYYTTKLEEVV